MTSPTSASKTGRSIPADVKNWLQTEIERLDLPYLDAQVRGRFCYVTHAGTPLCRLDYRGTRDEWGFAIYRYSRGTYGDLPMAPTRGPVTEMIDMALHAYGLR